MNKYEWVLIVLERSLDGFEQLKKS